MTLGREGNKLLLAVGRLGVYGISVCRRVDCGAAQSFAARCTALSAASIA
jgi:hypothetical protein